MAARGRPLAPIVEPVSLGTAELTRDQTGGWTLRIDGVSQSYVDPNDPTRLEFGYLRWLARVIDHLAPAGEPLTVLHLGGGALTLPRYVAHTRPGSRQEVIEADEALAALVRRVLPIAADTLLEVHIADARAGVLVVEGAGYDLVVGDVYRGAHMPRHLSSVEFAAEVAQTLTGSGVYAVNITDLPPLTLSRVHAATLRAVFAEVSLIAEPETLRGRRYANLVLVAARAPDGLALTRLTRDLDRGYPRARVLHGADLDTFIAGAEPMTDATA